jgi:hypothetical protein
VYVGARITLDELQGAGWQFVIDGIENPQNVGHLDVVSQTDALGTAIHQPDAVRECVVAVQRLDGTHPDTLVSPEDVADPGNQCRNRPLHSSLLRFQPSGHS